jgi:hypothetical protein
VGLTIWLLMVPELVLIALDRLNSGGYNGFQMCKLGVFLVEFLCSGLVGRVEMEVLVISALFL